MATNDPYNDKKSRGLRGIFGKREKSMERPPVGISPDSAYASSTDAPSGERVTPSLTPDTVAVEKNSEIGNIDRDKNLALKPATGEVFDRDTGEVVTVVTTTTTTTTTTTSRGGGQNPEQNITKDVQREVQNIPASSASITPPPGVTEMPANTVDSRHSGVGMTGTGLGHNTSSGLPPTTAPRRSGEIPGHSPTGYSESTTSSDARLNAPFDPSREVSSGQQKHNFSYPSRAAPSGAQSGPSPTMATADQPVQHNPSTMADLKAAAKGIHGIGETLRGTFNDTVDRKFPSKNPDKATIANTKNAEVLSHGRAEMEHIPTHSSHGTSTVTDPGYDSVAREKSSGGLRNVLSRKPVGNTGSVAQDGSGMNSGPTTTTGGAVPNTGQAPLGAEPPKKHRFF